MKNFTCLFRAAHIIAFSMGVAATISAQTLNVYTGQVKTAVNASPDKMIYSDNGTKVNIAGKEFSVSDIDKIVVDQIKVEDNTVEVTFNGSTANVVVAGNIAKYLTATVNGANVSLVQSVDMPNEVTYTLQGSTPNGSFYVSGENEASLILNGVDITSPDSAAINIQNPGVKINIVKGTTNALVDGASGSQKACLVVKGHALISGEGSISITGNAKHGYSSGKYTIIEEGTGEISFLKSKKDAINLDQYLEVKGGTITASNVGDDGIQVSLTGIADIENDGFLIISGGKFDIDITADKAKGMKCDGEFHMTSGGIDILTTGNGVYEADENDVSGCACIKSDGNLTIDGGTLVLKSTGSGGKGISCDLDITINGGDLSMTTTGQQYVYSSTLDTSPKALKADNNLTINGGKITVSATGGEGSEGLESKNIMTINDGEIIINTYDDALNATNHIAINGGKIFAHATGNDAIDSNGTFEINGGVVIALGARAPEGPFDCDQNTFKVTGGVIIGLGGDSSTPTSSVTTQPVVLLGGKSYNNGTYISLDSSDGANLFAFKVPAAFSSSRLVVSNPDMKVGSSYTIKSGVTVTGGNEWQGYVDGGTVNGGSTLSTISVNSMVTTSGTSGGPGGRP